MLPTIIVGAGIAGLPAAIQLAKAGQPSIVIERCPGLETKGQNIDLRGPGQEVMIRMGLDKAVRSKSTKETGTSFEDEHKKQWAFFGAAPEGEKRFSPTSDVEILRGDLADIFYQEALKYPDLISFRLGAKIATIEEDAESVTLKLVDGESLRGNILIGADGQGSQIRSLCLASTSKVTVRSFDMYTAYYTLPRLPQDTNVWRIHNATRGRSLFLRPDGSETTVRGCLNVHRQSDPKTIEAFAQRVSELHKQTLKSLFADVGWEGPRLIAALDSTKDFYLQPIVQVRMDKWHHGRVVVLGDAAWAPSPLTGMGTTLAVTGAYLLTWHLNRTDNPLEAFTRYEDQYRAFVEKSQSVPPGVPGIAHPQTALGGKVLRWVVYGVSLLARLPFVASVFTPSEDRFPLPAEH